MNFGYETQGGDSWDTGKFFASRFVIPEAGILNSISVYLQNESGSVQNIQVGIYNDNAGAIGTKLVSSANVSIPIVFNDWKTVNLSANLNLGSAYWLTVQLENSAAIVWIFFDAGDVNQEAWKETWTFGSWPDNPAGISYYNDKISIYATYTPVVPSAYTWGLLSKNQINPEKIEEAINRLIAEHEADPDSHLGAGESLEAHRASEVIDHLAASVVADKFTGVEFVLNLPFESLDKYTKSVAGINSDIAGFRLDTGTTINTERYLSAPAQYSNTYFTKDRDTTFQFFAHLYVSTNQIAYVMAGGEGILAEPPGVGFKFQNGNLYACEVVWGEVETEEYTSQITGITINNKHVYRVQVVASEGVAYFYVDGILKTTLTLHASADVGLILFSTYLKNTAAEQKQLWVSGIYYAINPL